MIRSCRGVGAVAWSLLALLSPAATLAAPAAWLGFRNDTNMPVIVQGSSVVNNAMRHGKPNLLYQGTVSWERVTQPGSKIITIYDPKQPKLILFQGTVVIAAGDLFFSIEVDPPPPLRPGEKPPPPKLKL